MQARVVAEGVPFAHCVAKPVGDVGWRQALLLNRLVADLLLCLDGVAAIHKQCAAAVGHCGQAGGTGKSGKPGETLVGGGHIFVLVLVAPGHQESL